MSEINEGTPGNIDELVKSAGEKANYKLRLETVEILSKWNCQQSKDVLWRLMMNDKVYSVQEQAFRALQGLGHEVKLPKKKKGKVIKDIDQKIIKIKKSFLEEFTIEEFIEKFKQVEPEAYDVYMFEKGSSFSKWLQNIIQSLPKN